MYIKIKAFIRILFLKEEIAKSKEADSQREALEKKEKEFFLLLEKKVNSVGNLVHESVPIEKNEDLNKVERTWGKIPDLKVDSTLGKCHHHEILAMIDGYDPKRGKCYILIHCINFNIFFQLIF